MARREVSAPLRFSSAGARPRVIATAGAADLEYVRGLGADGVVDFRAERFEDKARAVDAVVLTHRPEFQSRWSQHGHVIALNLSKLTRAQSSAIVSKLADSKALPPELVEQILAKTDGVPLFIEELTKSVLESGELKGAGDRYDYAGATHRITIPATLRDSLMARLDRFMPVKEIAQIGGAIGREFSYELITVVAPLPQAKVDDALAQLTESGLAFRRGTPPEATYTFQHALVTWCAPVSIPRHSTPAQPSRQ